MTTTRKDGVLTGIDARRFFHQAVRSAISNQDVSASHETVCYVANLLTGFVRTDRLFEVTADGTFIKPLALMYADALEAPTAGDRAISLQRLGDVALFISGLFAHSLNRSLVDVDYYIRIGGSAYGTLADSNRRSRNAGAFRVAFLELADRFAEFVDVLSEVGEHSHLNNSTSILRLYEIWQATGSGRAARRLREHGIQPVKTLRHTH